MGALAEWLRSRSEEEFDTAMLLAGSGVGSVVGLSIGPGGWLDFPVVFVVGLLSMILFRLLGRRWRS